MGEEKDIVKYRCTNPKCRERYNCTHNALHQHRDDCDSYCDYAKIDAKCEARPNPTPEELKIPMVKGCFEGGHLASLLTLR